MNHSAGPHGCVVGREPAATREANLHRLHWVTVSVAASLQTLCQPVDEVFFLHKCGWESKKKLSLIKQSVKSRTTTRNNQLSLGAFGSPPFPFNPFIRFIISPHRSRPCISSLWLQLKGSHLASLPSTYFHILNIFFLHPLNEKLLH